MIYFDLLNLKKHVSVIEWASFNTIYNGAKSRK